MPAAPLAFARFPLSSLPRRLRALTLHSIMDASLRAPTERARPLLPFLEHAARGAGGAAGAGGAGGDGEQGPLSDATAVLDDGCTSSEASFCGEARENDEHDAHDAPTAGCAGSGVPKFLGLRDKGRATDSDSDESNFADDEATDAGSDSDSDDIVAGRWSARGRAPGSPVKTPVFYYVPLTARMAALDAGGGHAVAVAEPAPFAGLPDMTISRECMMGDDDAPTGFPF